MRWEQAGDEFRLHVDEPETLSGRIYLPAGYVFAGDDLAVKPLQSGSYTAKTTGGRNKSTEI